VKSEGFYSSGENRRHPCNLEGAPPPQCDVADPAPHLADLVLVDRCLEGEQAAARELFRAHQGRVHGSLYRVLGANRDMDDLLQETFIQVFRSLGGFRGEARLSTWIDRIAVRVAYRHLARRRTQLITVELAEDDSPAGPAAVDERMLAREGVRRFYAALAQLGAASRIAYTLHEVDGRPVAEVARLVDASVTTTKLRIWRARRALMKMAAADPVLAEFLGESE
jgi:RNA polymerase sigma-70 factor, ECF subfamily